MKTNFEVIQSALKCVNVNAKVKVLSIIDIPEDCDSDTRSVEGYRIDGVYLYKVINERITNSIGKWMVGYDYVTSGGHWEPDDCEFIIHSEMKSFQNSIIEVINLINKQRLDNFFECLVYENDNE